jgi:hypothetical protein
MHFSLVKRYRRGSVSHLLGKANKLPVRLNRLLWMIDFHRNAFFRQAAVDRTEDKD